MLWLVAAIVFVVVTWTVRRYLKQDRLIPSGFMNALEAVVEFIRDSIVLPNVGKKWVNTWTPLHADVLLLHPERERHRPDSDLRRRSALLDHFVLHTAEDSFVEQVHARRHDGDRRTSTSRRRWRPSRSSPSSSPASKAHGFVKHWKNMVPHGLRLADLHPADPDRDHGHVRPAVRADDATCGQHDGRAHRDPGDSVVRVHLHRDVRHGASPASASASRCRCRWRSASRRSRSSWSWSRRTCSRC